MRSERFKVIVKHGYGCQAEQLNEKKEKKKEIQPSIPVCGSCDAVWWIVKM